jgi:pseudaminic acid biosynthesis-associated methylase
MADELERFWKGDFGNSYTARNIGNVEKNEMFFQRVLYTRAAWNGESIVEFGAGSGENLKALRRYLPDSSLTAVEINDVAIEELKKIQGVTTVKASILDTYLTVTAGLVFTKGLLIHIAPKDLPAAYRQLYRSSTGRILIAEYYNPTPVEVPYRGHAGRLWKRDFAGEMLAMFPDLQLVDYGFVYRGDQYPQDDITWFMLRIKGRA